MKRRAFLTMVLSSMGALIMPKKGKPWPVHGSGPPSPFNGGRSQGQSAGLAGGGDFPFINCLKTAEPWNDASGFLPDPSTLDSDGYPTSMPSAFYHTSFAIPQQSERAGDYKVTWTGDGAAISCGGVTGSGVNSSFTITAPAGGILNFYITATGFNASNRPRAVSVYHVDDEAAYLAGEIFGTLFLAKLRQAKFGVYRFMTWQNTNQSNMSQWAHRKPASYVFYYGSELRANLYGGVTTNSGNDYSVTAPGAWSGDADKATVTVKWNASGSSTTPTLKVGAGSAFVIKTFGGQALAVSDEPVSGGTSTLTLDLDLNCWLKLDGYGLENGVPPEICARLCNEVGMHPQFAMPFLAVDPITDYPIQLATYVRDTYSWMIPRFEGPNECWNFIFSGTLYADNKAFVHWGNAFDFSNWYGKVMSVLGQAVSTVYGADRSRYQILCGVQTGLGTDASGTASVDVRLTSAAYVAQAAAPQSPYTKTAAKLWVTHVCCATYMGPSEQRTNQETIDAFNYVVTNAGNPTAQLALATGFANTLASGSGTFNLANIATYYANWKTWGAGWGVNGLTAYEGGYSPDDPVTQGTSNITGATKAAQCVLTLADYSIDGVTNSGNPAVAGMTLTLSGVGGMTQLNGNTYTVVSVSGNSVTINVDSTGFSTYTSGGSALYVSAIGWIKTLRRASKAVASIQTHLTTNYNSFVTAGGTFPSCFQLAGDSTWGVWDPDIYASPTPPQWSAIVAFNA